MLVGTVFFEPTLALDFVVFADSGVSFVTVVCFALRQIGTYFIVMSLFTMVSEFTVTRKSSICLYFHEKIMILDFKDYNGTPL